MLASLKRFFATTEGSIQGFLSMEELYRSILTSLGSGTLIGVLILVIQGLLSDVAIVFPNPAVASLATVILTMILDLLRRQAQGTTPVPPAVTPPAKSTTTQSRVF
jgi:hypothetical protein